ncbi:MAG: hypothetical protein U0Z53_11625 [Blastocatellia bacterium]
MQTKNEGEVFTDFPFNFFSAHFWNGGGVEDFTEAQRKPRLILTDKLRPFAAEYEIEFSAEQDTSDSHIISGDHTP